MPCSCDQQYHSIARPALIATMLLSQVPCLQRPLNCQRASRKAARNVTVQVAARNGAQQQQGSVLSIGSAVGAACIAASLLMTPVLAPQPALADLSAYEYNIPGEFDKGSARQYGEGVCSNISGVHVSLLDRSVACFTSWIMCSVSCCS